MAYNAVCPWLKTKTTTKKQNKIHAVYSPHWSPIGAPAVGPLVPCGAAWSPASPQLEMWKHTRQRLSESSWHSQAHSTPDVVVLYCSSGPMKYCNRIRTAVSYCTFAHEGLSIINVHRSVHVVQTLYRTAGMMLVIRTSSREAPFQRFKVIFKWIHVLFEPIFFFFHKSQQEVSSVLAASVSPGYFIHVGERVGEGGNGVNFPPIGWFVKTCFLIRPLFNKIGCHCSIPERVFMTPTVN